YLLMMIGFGGKAGMFPLHAWLPSAHPIAPSPASAVLSGIITKAGVLAIIRVTYYIFGVNFLYGSWAQTICIGLAIFTIFMGSMLAYKEKVLKKRLAYSTVSQVSYVLFALFVMTPAGFIGAILQIIYHALAKNMLFLSAGSIIYKTGLKRVDEYRGLGKTMPLVMLVFTLASLSLIGIPPMGGFVSKWMIAQGALTNMIGFVGVAVLMISALLTAGYTLPIVIGAFFPGNNYDYKNHKKDDVNGWMGIPLIILMGCLILLSVYPKPILDCLSLLIPTILY
ncbi:MAG: proton-conducting transporter membrane subunit, partial [Erysipelotrichaceae bacterium]|nr:proton-conducting transporter membrane subunit [Erysipelotrichaceae bacterium]